MVLIEREQTHVLSNLSGAEAFYHESGGVHSPGFSGRHTLAGPRHAGERPARETLTQGGAGPETARAARLHMRLGRWFTAFFSVGYALGLGGMRFALEGPLYETAHSYFATLALGLFWTTAWLGRRLRRNLKNDDLRQIHSYCGFLAVFIALFVAVLGMRLLP